MHHCHFSSVSSSLPPCLLWIICLLFDAVDFPQWIHLFLLRICVSNTVSDSKLYLFYKSSRAGNPNKTSSQTPELLFFLIFRWLTVRSIDALIAGGGSVGLVLTHGLRQRDNGMEAAFMRVGSHCFALLDFGLSSKQQEVTAPALMALSYWIQCPVLLPLLADLLRDDILKGELTSLTFDAAVATAEVQIGEEVLRVTFRFRFWL